MSLTCTQTALELPGARWAPPGFFLMSLELPVLGSVWSRSCRPAAGPRAAARRWYSEPTAEPSSKRTSAASPAATPEPLRCGGISGPDANPVCQGGVLPTPSREPTRFLCSRRLQNPEAQHWFPPCVWDGAHSALPALPSSPARVSWTAGPLVKAAGGPGNLASEPGRRDRTGFSRRRVHVHGVSVRACVVDFRSARAGPAPGFAPACCVAPVGQEAGPRDCRPTSEPQRWVQSAGPLGPGTEAPSSWQPCASCGACQVSDGAGASS